MKIDEVEKNHVIIYTKAGHIEITVNSGNLLIYCYDKKDTQKEQEPYLTYEG